MAGFALEMTLADFAAACDRQAGQMAGLSFEQPLKIIAHLARADMVENFQGSHDPSGAPWLPLKRPRANSKGEDKPLLNTGILQASVRGGGQASVETITPTYMEVGTNLDYAPPHQFGAAWNVPEKARKKPWVFPGLDGRAVFTRRIKAHKNAIPARPFAGWSERLLHKCDQVLLDFIERNAI